MAKVLLIEDDQDQVLLYSTKFQLEGYDIVSAPDGFLGIKMAEKEKPDIILLDLVMEKLDGLAVLKELKSRPAIKDIPVLLFTNLAKKDLAEEAQKMGAIGYILKSNYTPREVVEKVSEILQQKLKKFAKHV